VFTSWLLEVYSSNHSTLPTLAIGDGSKQTRKCLEHRPQIIFWIEQPFSVSVRSCIRSPLPQCGQAGLGINGTTTNAIGVLPQSIGLRRVLLSRSSKPRSLGVLVDPAEHIAALVLLPR
jgi:hypothetical protein